VEDGNTTADSKKKRRRKKDRLQHSQQSQDGSIEHQ